VIALVTALVVGAEFSGPQACQECHAKIYEQQKSTHHANALRPILESGMRLTPMTERGGASFRYEAIPSQGIQLTTTMASGYRLAMLEWAFGAGAKAFTAVGRLGDGSYVEHRISWYSAGNRLGLTPGHSTSPSLDAREAIGIQQTNDSMYRCFNCHAANVKAGPDISAMIPGVTCERCHGAGSEHIAAAKAGKDLKATVFNAGKLTAKAMVPVCAECHRSPNQVYRSEMPEVEDPLSVRFAPVGFTASKCFQKSSTFSCISCHNPHQDPLPARDPAYTKVCHECHQQGTRAACKSKQTANCVSCHMKQSSPVPNLSFTDHRIRTYFF
jgi:hypothetical protein